MEEKKPMDTEMTGTEQLTDEQLGGIVGGLRYVKTNTWCYKYVGSTSDADWNASYLCPKCRKPVHYTGWGWFRCDPCDESWFDEGKLVLNLDSGLWKQISKEEYWYHTTGGPDPWKKPLPGME